jgi:small subunit ribosomal protein S20
MANSKQASKRNRQREKARVSNRVVLGSMRTAVRKAKTAVDEGTKEAPELVRFATSRVDRAVTRGALKRRTASRLISRLVTHTAAQ